MRALALLALTFVNCGDTIILPTQSVNVAQGVPSPTPAPVAAAFDSVSLEIFDHACPNAPPRGEPLLRVGCLARITATPKARGIAVPPEAHGAACNWFLNGAPVNGVAESSVVRVVETANPFNVSATGFSAGTFTLEAEVLGVRSGTKVFQVSQ